MQRGKVGGKMMNVDMSKEALRKDGKRGEDRRRGGKEEETSREGMGRDKESRGWKLRR